MTEKKLDVLDEDTAEEEKPHGMPLASAGGGYGGEPCTGPKAERAGQCPDTDFDEAQ